jgi:hypothetical protein
LVDGCSARALPHTGVLVRPPVQEAATQQDALRRLVRSCLSASHDSTSERAQVGVRQISERCQSIHWISAGSYERPAAP